MCKYMKFSMILSFLNFLESNIYNSLGKAFPCKFGRLTVYLDNLYCAKKSLYSTLPNNNNNNSKYQ